MSCPVLKGRGVCLVQGWSLSESLKKPFFSQALTPLPPPSPECCVFAHVFVSVFLVSFVSMFRDGCLSSFRSSFLLLVPICYSSSPAWACRFGLLRFLWGLSGGVFRGGVALSFGSRMVRGSVLLAVALVLFLGFGRGPELACLLCSL